MWFRQVEVPDELVEAATDGKLVLFVGAGASLEEPSGLPDFANLVRDVGTRANRAPTDRDLDRPDVFLGDLADLEIDVHRLVANAIDKPGSQPNRLHEAIIDLALVHPNPRVVTTNYDLHLEGARRSSELGVDVYRAPALPVGDDFTGVVHLHGALDQPPRKLVVTDKDFGHAYLREAWAARFLDRMFSAFSVAFIGYSHGDIVMQYLARSLGREGRRFVFTHDADSREWRRLGLRPVHYPVDGSSHLALVDGLERWAELTAWGRLAHRRRIAELVSNGPPTIPEEVSYLEQALGHPERVHYFIEQARGSDWLSWAANRPEFNRLFDPTVPSDADRPVTQALTTWVVDQYVMDEQESPTALRLLRSRPWSPGIWDTVAHRLFAQERRVPDWQVPWLVLVLHRSPADHGDLLDMLLCKESWQERPDLALMLLEHRTRPLPRSGLDFGPSSDAPRFDVAFVGDGYWLDDAWKKVFVPLLPQHASELLDLAVRQLRDANRLAGALQPGFDALSFGRSAIEPHPQDEFREVADVLIDAARDSLEHLLRASTQEGAAAAVERLARAPEPILRRLAVHAWRVREDRSPEEKLRWLLAENLLYNLDLQHEVYMLLGDTVALASDDAVGAVLDRATDGPQDEGEHSPYVAYNLLAWLRNAAPENATIAQEFTRLQEQNPEFTPREHPDLNMTMTSGFVEDAEPFTRDELHELIKFSPDEAYAAIRSYVTADEFRLIGSTWTGALNALRGCVTHYPSDGVRLAVALAPDDSDVRDALVRAWSAANLSSKPEPASGVEPLEENQPRPFAVTPDDVLEVIASWPVAAVRSAVANMLARGGTADHPTAWHTLMPARRLAIDLWPTTQVTGNVVDSEDHYLEAINHPAGDLAQFWIKVVAHEWRAHFETWSGLPDELRAELDRMVQDQSRNGFLARVLLSTRLRFFTGADHAWAKSRLMPLFSWDKDAAGASEVRGIWRSFVQYGQYDDQILADGFLDAMLATMRRANDLDDESIAQLGRQLATVALKSSLDPKDWLHALTTDAPTVMQLAWIRSVGRQLRDMDPKEASAQWSRWISEYWTGRIDSLPRPLTTDEASAMALWVLGLPDDRPAAVELVVLTDAGLVKDDRVLMHLTGSRREHEDLTRDPETWARYLVHLLRGTTDPPWALDHYLREVIGVLRPVIPATLLAELIEEAMRLGCTDAGDW